MSTKKICEVCGKVLKSDDGYLSCPVYLTGKNMEADEHTSVPIKVPIKNENWNKKYTEGDDDYKYFCGCGAKMDELFYNADTGHYECPHCGSESPDLEMIPVVD